jgi:hypothetical protein
MVAGAILFPPGNAVTEVCPGNMRCGIPTTPVYDHTPNYNFNNLYLIGLQL